jgi:hypothetical protein
MFATFYLDREPLTLSDLPDFIKIWVQNWGGVATVGLVIFLTAWAVGNLRRRGHIGGAAFFGTYYAVSLAVNFALVVLLFTAIGVVYMFRGSSATAAGTIDWLRTLAGAFAMLAVTLPVLYDLFTRMRWQRIWALARVSLKEAVRKRVVLVFAAMALIFLFAGWFIPYKAENQLRNYVSVVYFGIMVVFLLTAGLLGAFGIPTDVKNQSIHIIVTKPVEKFEIVLGRFLGYATLLTVGLAIIGGLSLIYVLRGVNPDAAFESLKARVPVYGRLGFYGTKGDSVGREWDYRRYVSAPQPGQVNAPRQFAFWSFKDLPAELGERSGPVTFEFTFDVFRLNKGTEGKGIFCTFTFADGRLNMVELEQTVKNIHEERTRRQAELAKKPMAPEERQAAFTRIGDELIKKYGVLELAGEEVTDYHTQTLQIPAAFFKRLTELETEKQRDPGIPMMNVLVNVDRSSLQQMLGVAPRDFYLLADERSFEVNFLKGMMGMWCTFLLVLGVGIACSTYLSGVISWVCTMFLFGAGLFTDYIRRLAEGSEAGGGPLEAAYRIINRSPLAAPIDPGPGASILEGTDQVFRWWLGRFLSLLPDVSRWDLHHYVANGFDISWGLLVADNFVPLALQLLPWGVLAFYLMKFREIANPM